MTEVVAVVSTLVGIGLQLKDSIDRVKYNRETHRVIINRISDSLRRLKVEARKASSKSSPSLVKAIAKLKRELEHALEKSQREILNKNSSGIRQWFQRDSIESVLKDVEKQISNCFQEFTALAAIRIERKLGDHNAQVNRKLDELLRQSSRHHPQLSNRPRSGTPDIFMGRVGVSGRAGMPSSPRLSDRSNTPIDRARGSSLDLPRPRDTISFAKAPLSASSSSRTSAEDLTFSVHLPTRSTKSGMLRRKPPPAARSESSVIATSISSVSSTSPSSPPSLESPVPTVAAGMTRPQVRPRILSHPVLSSVGTAARSGTIPIAPSPTSPTFPSPRPIFPNSPNFSNPTLTTSFFPDGDHANLFSQANDYDTECRRLRSLKHPNEALTAARNAVRLRRSIISTFRDSRNVTALARSLIYMGRCLRDLYTDSKAETAANKKKGGLEVEILGQELTRVWAECAELYKEAFLQDKSLRVELATVLYNLSAKLSEPTHGNESSPRSNIYHNPMTSMTSLSSRDAALSRDRAHELDLETALDAAEEAVHHFTVLERDEPEAYSMDLANAQLNLSFILSDLGRNSKALAVARKAVILAYRLTSTDPHTQERVRIMRTLHKSLMRVSYCLRDLGKNREADEAEMEAKDALKKQFFVLGS